MKNKVDNRSGAVPNEKYQMMCAELLQIIFTVLTDGELAGQFGKMPVECNDFYGRP